MRLDKYLKISQLVKRRTIAKEIADKGRIEINDHPAKSSTSVNVGDKITIHYGNKILVVEVLKIAENVKKNKAAGLYRTVDKQPQKTCNKS